MKNKQIQNPSLFDNSPKQSIPELRSKRKLDQYCYHQDVSKIKIDFNYSFQDYLKMALCKLIPHEGIIIDPQEKFIYGDKDDCVKLKKKIQKEFSSKKYKKIQFKKQVDFDEIEYELPPKFQSSIYRPGYISRALSSLQLYNSLQYSCRKFKELLKKGNIIILRVKSDYQGECMQKIEQILKNSSQGISQNQPQNKSQPHPHINRQTMQEQSYEQVIDEQANYYKIKEQLTNKQQQKIAQEINQTHYSIEQSQFNLTQTNSSFLMDDQQEREIPSCPDQPMNRSYM